MLCAGCERLDREEGDQGRLPPVRPELLPALPARSPPGGGGRHVDRSPRLPLPAAQLGRQRLRVRRGPADSDGPAPFPVGAWSGMRPMTRVPLPGEETTVSSPATAASRSRMLV